MPRHGIPTTVNRRRFVQATGLGGAAFASGCLGDDEVDPDDIDDADDVDDEDDVDDVDDVDDTDDADDADDALELPEVKDITVWWSKAHDLPPDLQYNPYADQPTPAGNSFGTGNWTLIHRSVSDMDIYGLVVDDWSYEPGLLEFSFHDDFFWWSGKPIGVDDLMAEYEFRDYIWGGDELDAYPSIVTRDQVDDETVRFALADAWHEEWALNETILESSLTASSEYYEPWNEQFRDAPDLDAIQEIREEIEDDVVNADDRLVHFWNNDMEFRMDGSLGEVGEDYYIFELVQTKHGTPRHFQNPENHDFLPDVKYFRLEIRSEGVGELRMDQFMEGRDPFLYGESNPEGVDMHLDGEFDFDTDLMIFPRPPNDQGGMQFNHETHPGDDPNFRRAMAFLVDHTAWEGHPDAIAAERIHTFLSESELETFVSADVIDAFTDYTYDAMAQDEAAEELVAGGFEQDADGNWLLREDGAEGDAGAPMDFTIDTPSFMPYVLDQATDWWADLEGFGIQNEVIHDGFGIEDWTFTYSYTGGGTPDDAFNHVFNDGAPTWSRRDQSIPSTVLAPPFLETAGPGANINEWEEYDVGAMTDRLPVTTDREQYQSLVDQLSWVINQACNHFSTSPVQRHHVLNAHHWEWAPLDVAPERYHNLLMDLGETVVRAGPANR